VVLFYHTRGQHAAARCYTDKVAFDGVDLSDIDIGNGESVTAVQEVAYLGSYATQAGTDLKDVEERISKASPAFGGCAVRCSAQALPLSTEGRHNGGHAQCVEAAGGLVQPATSSSAAAAAAAAAAVATKAVDVATGSRTTGNRQ
jgi:hypothetical protein